MTSVSTRHCGFLSHLCRELSPEKEWHTVPPPHVEWAARILECVRAGLGDTEFSRLLNGVNEIMADLTDEPQPVQVG